MRLRLSVASPHPKKLSSLMKQDLWKLLFFREHVVTTAVGFPDRCITVVFSVPEAATRMEPEGEQIRESQEKLNTRLEVKKYSVLVHVKKATSPSVPKSARLSEKTPGAERGRKRQSLTTKFRCNGDIPTYCRMSVL